VKTVLGVAAVLAMVRAGSAGVYWGCNLLGMAGCPPPDFFLALFDALPALRVETLGEFRKGARHLAKVRCE
jgi:hypothetical protein